MRELKSVADIMFERKIPGAGYEDVIVVDDLKHEALKWVEYINENPGEFGGDPFMLEEWIRTFFNLE